MPDLEQLSLCVSCGYTGASVQMRRSDFMDSHSRHLRPMPRRRASLASASPEAALRDNLFFCDAEGEVHLPLLTAGADEPGRGPLAGPVCAAAVILDPENPIEGLADSKKLSAKKREALAPIIRERALAWGIGWATAEYAMLPRSTNTRKKRDIKSLKLDGRSSEIQRLIGRALRAVVDREALGERQITIDCDVIQADGGTRCASITGGYAALDLACRKLVDEGVIENMPLTAAVSAVSVGIFEDEAVLDLNYAEDSHAIVDCNVVMTSKGEFIEVQGTGEGRPFTRNELDQLLALGEQGCSRLCEIQKSVLGE